MLNSEKKYSINPKIAELINKQKQKLGMEQHKDISNVESENIISNWIKYDKVDTRIYSKNDKEKLLFHIYNINPNNTEKDQMKKISNNIINIFDQDEKIELSKKIISIYYKPGIVFHNIRTYNDGVMDFISSLNWLELYNGIFINKTFIGDMLKIFPDILYSKETGEITDPDIDQNLSTFIDFIKEQFADIKICKKNDFYVIATDNQDTLEKLKINFKKLKIESIPAYYFNWF